MAPGQVHDTRPAHAGVCVCEFGYIRACCARICLPGCEAGCEDCLWLFAVSPCFHGKYFSKINAEARLPVLSVAWSLTNVEEKCLLF